MCPSKYNPDERQITREIHKIDTQIISIKKSLQKCEQARAELILKLNGKYQPLAIKESYIVMENAK
jgi:hypothetical protein